MLDAIVARVYTYISVSVSRRVSQVGGCVYLHMMMINVDDECGHTGLGIADVAHNPAMQR